MLLFPLLLRLLRGNSLPLRDTSSLVLERLDQVFGIMKMGKMELGLDPFPFASASIVFLGHVWRGVVLV